MSVTRSAPMRLLPLITLLGLACSDSVTAPDVSGRYFEAVSLDGEPLPVVIARYSGEGGVLCEQSFGGAVLVFDDSGNYQLPISSRVDCGEDWHRSSGESRGSYTQQGDAIDFEVVMSAPAVPVSATIRGDRISVILARTNGEELLVVFEPME